MGIAYPPRPLAEPRSGRYAGCKRAASEVFDCIPHGSGAYREKEFFAMGSYPIVFRNVLYHNVCCERGGAMKVVLLAGGFGTRISEESQFKPKPMVEIGGMPILWHIMKEYAFYGHTEFIICAGYRQEYIKDWFANYFLHSANVTFDYRDGKNEMTVHESSCEPWRVTIVDTGLYTMTGGRIKRVQKYVGNEPFFMTYGDGVCDVDMNKLLEFHRAHGKLATLTAVKLGQEKGVLNIGGDNAVKSFREKNLVDAPPINAGYMVLEPKVFDYIEGDGIPFEREPLEKLAKEGQLMSYVHHGFWQCMDNARERNMLEQLLSKNAAPWKVW